MNPICFYHKSDLDGVCSAAIVKHFVPECELYGIDYGDEFPWGKVEGQLGKQLPDGPPRDLGPDPEHPEFNLVSSWSFRVEARRTVYMVDFALKPEDMQRLAKVSNLTWIDKTGVRNV